MSLTAAQCAFTAKNGANIGTINANYVSILGSNAGSAVQILAQGTDTNINISLVPKGTGALVLSAALGVGATPSYGTSGQVLTSTGSTTAPTWSTPSGMTVGKSIVFSNIFG